MRVGRFLFVGALLMVWLVVVTPALAATINVPADVATIQEAINKADPGDTVHVAAGTYSEAVVVDKTLTLEGEGWWQTTIDGGGTAANVVDLRTSGIVVNGFTVQKSAFAWPAAGISFSSVSGCTVISCLVANNYCGMRFAGSTNNVIAGCAASGNDLGIDLGDTFSTGNTIRDSVAMNNVETGFNAYMGSDGLVIKDCQAYGNQTGIAVGWSYDWVIQHCEVTQNATGIVLDTARDGVIRWNTVAEQTGDGIYLAGLGTSRNQILCNTIAKNAKRGIVFASRAQQNTVRDNLIGDNDLGVYIARNDGYENYANLVYRNDFVGNTTGAVVDEERYDHGFDNGYPDAGNFWSDYIGGDLYSGPGQDVPGPDGIGDAPYSILVPVAVDHYPLMVADATPPETTLTGGPSGWINDAATFTWEGTDERTPAADLGYSTRFDGGSWQFDTATTRDVTLAEGWHTFEATARDGVGNDDPTPASREFGFDFTPPATAIDIVSGGWYPGPLVITLTPGDALSGPAYTEYMLGGDADWRLYTGGITVLGDGEKWITYRSVDNAGNVESPQTLNFFVDMDPPETFDDADEAWHNTDVTVTLSSFDDYSGVQKTEYSLDGGSFVEGTSVHVAAPGGGGNDGIHTIAYRSTDEAGNVESEGTCRVKISTQVFAFDHEPRPLGPSGDIVEEVITADLDGDGDQDVVSGSGAGEEYEIVAWENDGSPFVGRWPRHDLGASADTIWSLGAADLDRDGDLDLVSGSGDQEDAAIVAWRNDGTPFDGLWPAQDIGPVTSSGSYHVEIALADLDKDLWVDVVSLTSSYGGTGALNLWRNDGAPFAHPWSPVGIYTTYSMGAVATGDFDRDGWTDIAFTRDEYFLQLAKNLGNPFAGAWYMGTSWGVGPGMTSEIAVADLDLDAWPDLATALGYMPSWEQSAMRNPQSNPFAAGWSGVVYGDTPAVSVAAGDLDLNGLPDLVTASHGNEDYEIIAWSNWGMPFPGGFTQYDVGATADGGRAVALADFDKDGDLDIVSASGAAAEDELLLWQNLRLIDTVDPASSATYDGSWSTASIDLGLGASDDASGVQYIEYMVGETGDWRRADPAGIVRLGKRGWGSGVYNVYYRAVDNAGNVEDIHTLTVALDGRYPVSDDDADNLWHSEDVTVHFTASDQVSGVRDIRYSVDGGFWQVGTQVTIPALEDHSNDGIHEIRYYARDWAGNYEPVNTCTVKIDTTEPELRLVLAGRETVYTNSHRARSALLVVFSLREQASARTAVTLIVKDAAGKTLKRVRLGRVAAGRTVVERVTGAAAVRAVRVKLVARDAAGNVGTVGRRCW